MCDVSSLLFQTPFHHIFTIISLSNYYFMLLKRYMICQNKLNWTSQISQIHQYGPIYRRVTLKQKCKVVNNSRTQLQTIASINIHWDWSVIRDQREKTPLTLNTLRTGRYLVSIGTDSNCHHSLLELDIPVELFFLLMAILNLWVLAKALIRGYSKSYEDRTV